MTQTDFQRGDVVYFELSPDIAYIKRIVGLPGEAIRISDHQIYIDGEILQEPYETISPDYVMDEITLGQDEFFVLGDDRNHSADSHSWGPIPAASITYRVIP